jgi:hypothetical protein
VTFPLADEGETRAVKITLSPAEGAGFDASSVVVVGVWLVAALTVMLTAAEELAA